MPRKYFLLVFFAAFVALLPCVAGAQPFKLAEGLAGTQGSTVGPDGALYVTEGGSGSITRVDPWSGETTDFASGLPLNGQLVPGLGAVRVRRLPGRKNAIVSHCLFLDGSEPAL